MPYSLKLFFAFLVLNLFLSFYIFVVPLSAFLRKEKFQYFFQLQNHMCVCFCLFVCGVWVCLCAFVLHLCLCAFISGHFLCDCVCVCVCGGGWRRGGITQNYISSKKVGLNQHKCIFLNKMMIKTKYY